MWLVISDKSDKSSVASEDGKMDDESNAPVLQQQSLSCSHPGNNSDVVAIDATQPVLHVCVFVCPPNQHAACATCVVCTCVCILCSLHTTFLLQGRTAFHFQCSTLSVPLIRSCTASIYHIAGVDTHFTRLHEQRDFSFQLFQALLLHELSSVSTALKFVMAGCARHDCAEG